MLNPMKIALLRSRQIFKFGLLIKKDNKKNLNIRLVFHLNGLRSLTTLLFLYTTVKRTFSKTKQFSI